jgi:DNA-binding transcriptional regulator YiaG
VGAAKSVFWLFVARTIDGIFGANTSAAQAYVADVTPSEKRSRALGCLGAAFDLGFICAEMRVSKGLTQRQLAQAIGCSQGRISKLESGRDEDLRLQDLIDYTLATDETFWLM